jgi:hypothetical protein
MKSTKTILLGGAVLLFGCAAWAQEFPKFEVGADYSYARYAPSASSTQGHSLNGGGGTLVYNLNSYLGIKADLQGYGSNTSVFTIPAGTNFPGGGSAKVQGNLFTYMFGPQIKVRAHGFQPFGHLLFGAAHSNVYGNAFKNICQPAVGACSFSTAPSGNAFAMAFGGGVDIPINKTFSIRPGEVDYLLTRFNNNFTNANQSNFRYSAGVVFTVGGRK